MTARMLTLLAALLPLCAAAADPVAGDWEVAGGGAELRFTAGNADGRIDIVWLDGDDLSVPEGTVLGYAWPAGEGRYDCRTVTDPRGSDTRRNGTSRFIASIDAGKPWYMHLRGYEKGLRFDLRALLPYRLRHSVKMTDTRPADADVAVRTDCSPVYIEL